MSQSAEEPPPGEPAAPSGSAPEAPVPNPAPLLPGPLAPGTFPTATRRDLQVGRRVFHMATGTTVATLYWLFLDHHQVVYTLGLIACVLYVLEHARIAYPEIGTRMVWMNRFFLRAEERLKESASVPYAMGILLTILTFPKTASLVAIYVLALADPLAALIGIRFGRHRVLPNNKSLEGSAAYFLVTYLAALLVFAAVPGVTTWTSIGAALVVALLGTVFETLPIRIDDNLTIPLFTALIAWIVCGSFGIPT